MSRSASSSQTLCAASTRPSSTPASASNRGTLAPPCSAASALPSSAVSATWMCTRASRSWAAAAISAQASTPRSYAECGANPIVTRPDGSFTASCTAAISPTRSATLPVSSACATDSTPGHMTCRMPASRPASITSCSKAYISHVVVTPERSISTEPSVIPHHTSSGSMRPSRGHITSSSQAISGNPSPAPRTSVIGVCAWVLIKPGISRPPRRITGASVVDASAAAPTHAMRPSARTSTAPRSIIAKSSSQVSTTSAR